MSGPVQIVRLEKAAFIGGRFVREVKMRRPTQEEVDQAWASHEDPGERGLFLVALACGLPMSAVRKMGDGNQALLAKVYDEVTSA